MNFLSTRCFSRRPPCADKRKVACLHIDVLFEARPSALGKQRIKDTPREYHVAHLTYPAFLEDLVVFEQSQIRKIAYAPSYAMRTHRLRRAGRGMVSLAAPFGPSPLERLGVPSFAPCGDYGGRGLTSCARQPISKSNAASGRLIGRGTNPPLKSSA